MLCFVLAASCGDIDATEGRSGPPRVVSAVSTSNTRVRVVFSEPVSEGSADPGNFSIGQANVNSEAASLPVETATRTEDGVAIELITGSQNEVLYELTASNVRDLEGNVLAAPELLVNPSVTTFAGTPPSAGDGSLVDTDGDGLSDNVETGGWTVTVFLANGDLRQSTHTSDPTMVDTDGDGLNDHMELLAGSNPRNSDTDGDTIGDAEEKNVWRSNPTHQDTDGDGMPDPTELDFQTSPILADTDGDGFSDYEELFELNRDPLVSDMPRPQVTVNEFDLQLDLQYKWTDEAGEVKTHTESTSTSISQAQASSVSRSDTRSMQTTNSDTTEIGGEIGYSNGSFSAKVSSKHTFARSTARGYTSSVDRTTATESQRTQEQSVSNALQTSERRSVSKSITSASVKANVNISNDSNVPFTLANLEISALRQDRRGGGEFRPVATLVPSSGDDLELNLGPFDPERGPIIFENANIFPSVVEELMREPTGVIFKVANFDVMNEEGRIFAFSSDEVASRTAGITIDFGDGRVESRRIATHNRFMPDGRPEGISLARALELMGYELRDPGEPLSRPFPDPLPPAVRFSVGTRVDQNGVERLIRVGGVQNDFAPTDPEKRFWAVRANDETLPPNIDFSDIRLHAGDEIMLFYAMDVDEDGLFKREEVVYGSDDTRTDTDGDGLDDFEEVREGWMVHASPGTPYRAFPSPARRHSDQDELDDGQERALRTDPNRGDTDADGLKDHFEVNGSIEIRLFDGDNDNENDELLVLEPYSDVIELRDGGDGEVSTEVAEGTDDVQIAPLGSTVAEHAPVIGPGPDGVVETRPGGDEVPEVSQAIAAGFKSGAVCETAASGDDVQVTPVGDPMPEGSACVRAGRNGVLDTTPQTPDFVRAVHDGYFQIDPRLRDTDFDGIPDGREILLGTHPNASDATVLSDSDNDGLSDAEENSGWVVGNDGAEVTSNPLAMDTDDDRLPDVYERAIGTDPRKPDTDGDGLSDFEEFDASNEHGHYSSREIELAHGRCDAASACTRPTGGGTGSSALLADTDGDGLDDFEELRGDGWTVELADGSTVEVEDTNPNEADQDGDGWNDSKEKTEGTNPRERDTDGDGVKDSSDKTSLRSPTRKEKVVDVNAPSKVVVQGDCDIGTDGSDFHGWLTFTFVGDGNGSGGTYDMNNCDDVDEGSVCGGTGWNETFFMVPDDKITLTDCIGADGDDCTGGGTVLDQTTPTYPSEITYQDMESDITTYQFEEATEDDCRVDVTLEFDVK
ncbi:MAG: hypothetical protein ACOCXM_00560 [Myxococcota bacterium]